LVNSDVVLLFGVVGRRCVGLGQLEGRAAPGQRQMVERRYGAASRPGTRPGNRPALQVRGDVPEAAYQEDDKDELAKFHSLGSRNLPDSRYGGCRPKFLTSSGD